MKFCINIRTVVENFFLYEVFVYCTHVYSNILYCFINDFCTVQFLVKQFCQTAYLHWRHCWYLLEGRFRNIEMYYIAINSNHIRIDFIISISLEILLQVTFAIGWFVKNGREKIYTRTVFLASWEKNPLLTHLKKFGDTDLNYRVSWNFDVFINQSYYVP